MAGAARVGDLAVAFADGHNCPKCPHTTIGPAVMGSTNVLVNGLPALRLGDRGVHAACCRSNLWASIMGSPTVLVNGRPFSRIGDATLHCGGPGMLVMGSPNVLVGMASGCGGGTTSTSEVRPHPPTPSPVNGRRGVGDEPILPPLRPSTGEGGRGDEGVQVPQLALPPLQHPSHITQTAAHQSRAIIQGRGLEHAAANTASEGISLPVEALVVLGVRPAPNLPPLQKLEAFNHGAGVVIGVLQLPQNIDSLRKEETFSAEWWDALSGVASVPVGMTDAAWYVQEKKARQAVTEAVQKAMPNAPASVKQAAIEEALRQAGSAPNRGPRVPSHAETGRVQDAAKKAHELEKGNRGTNAVRAIENKGAKAAMRTARKTVAPLLAKSARMVPFANAAFAGLDAVVLVQTGRAYMRGEATMTALVIATLKVGASGAGLVPVLSIPAGAVGIGLDVVGAILDPGESP